MLYLVIRYSVDLSWTVLCVAIYNLFCACLPELLGLCKRMMAVGWALSLVENHIAFTIESGSGHVAGKPQSSMRIRSTFGLCLVLSASLMSAGGDKLG